MPDKADDKPKGSETTDEPQYVGADMQTLPGTVGVVDPNAVPDAVAKEVAKATAAAPERPAKPPKQTKAKASKQPKAAKQPARAKAAQSEPVDEPEEGEEGRPAPLPKARRGHTYVQYIGHADVLSHGEMTFRPGAWVEVPNDALEALLTHPYEEFRTMEAEGDDG
jgi:hypothetical protein